MRTLVPFTLGLISLAAAASGCVMKTQYDALRADFNALQMRLNSGEQQANVERATMRQQVDQYNMQAGMARTDADQCRAQMAHVMQTQAEIRTKLELAMPLLTHIVNAVSPAATAYVPTPGPSTAAVPYPPRLQ